MPALALARANSLSINNHIMRENYRLINQEKIRNQAKIRNQNKDKLDYQDTLNNKLLKDTLKKQQKLTRVKYKNYSVFYNIFKDK